MKTQNITAARMNATGVSFADSHWYFTQGRPGGFSKPGDAQRASKILKATIAAKH